MSPKISVFITSYNQKAYLTEAIESVLNQTLKPFEIIIVDDYSTDGSREVIADYASRYPELIIPIYHTHNQGVAQTRIDALQAVTGDYVTYVDGDDKYRLTKLEKEAKLLQENPNAQIAFSNYYYITADGIYSGVWADKQTPPQGNIFRQTFARNFPRRSLFRNEMVQYQAWKKVGFYDPNLNLYEDWDMRIRLSKYYQAVYYDEPLTEYRIHKTGLSSTKAARHLTVLEYIYQKNMPLLDELSVAERKDIQRKLGRCMAEFALVASEEALRDSQHERDGKKQALKYYFQCLKYQHTYLDYKLILRILLPHSVYSLLRAMSHKVEANKLASRS